MAESDLQPAQIEELRHLLQTRKAAIEKQMIGLESDTQPVTLDQQSVGRVSRIDAIQQQQMAIANQQQIEQQARQVNQALSRLDTGDYGACRDCGETIAFARLKAQPFAPLCITCQASTETR